MTERGIGKLPDYSYSEALTGKTGKWDPGLLQSLVMRTDTRFAATTMPIVPGLAPADYARVLAYLATKKDVPPNAASPPAR